MIVETLIFAVLFALFAVPLAVAFGRDDWAALLRLRRRWRVHRYAVRFHQQGIDLIFAYHQLAHTPPRRRLAGGAR